MSRVCLLFIHCYDKLVITLYTLVGERCDGMYIVETGEVTVTKLDANDDIRNGPRRVAVLKKGDYFGERALMKSTRRAATVTTTTSCNLLKLDASAFALLLGPLEDIMNQQLAKYIPISLFPYFTPKHQLRERDREKERER